MDYRHVAFNKKEKKELFSIEEPNQEEIQNELGIWNADIDTCLAVCSPITKRILGEYERPKGVNIIVDVKTYMLMPGFIPAIPGWHTDGVPRGIDNDPIARDVPNLYKQFEMEDVNFKLLVTGNDCLTEFVDSKYEMNLPNDLRTINLYNYISSKINLDIENKLIKTSTVKPNTMTSFDWWDIHRANTSKTHFWRYFIRITETPHNTGCKDSSKIIRKQQQVYLDANNFGW